MTHAALKDRIDTLRDLREDYGYTPGKFSAERDALDAAIAALSAMEGDAVAPGSVAWMAEVLRGAASHIEVRGQKPYVEHLRTIATYIERAAPPPQQAVDRSWLLDLVPEAQTFNDGMEDREWCAGFNSCRRLTLGNIERSALAPKEAGHGS